MGVLRIIVSSIFVFAFVPLAHAEDVGSAKEHYDRGTTLYDLQRYAEAAREYEAAYEAKHDPALLFNLGQAYRFACDYARAIGAFRSFLRRFPKSPNRPEVEARIDEMQKLVDEQKQNMEKPPAGTIPPAGSRGDASPLPPETARTALVPPPPIAQPTAPSRGGSDSNAVRSARIKRTAGLVVAGVGVGALAVGIVFAVLARSAYDEINSPASGYVFNPSTQDQLKTTQPADIVLLAVGAAAVAAGITTFALGWREGKKASARASLLPAFSRDRASLALSLTF